MKKEKVKAQILIITLLVLTILSIITVSLIILVNKDVKQVVSNDKYEQSYNAAESQLGKYLDKYANYKLSPIDTILSDATLNKGCILGTQSPDRIEVNCSPNDNSNLTAFKLDNTSVVISDLKRLDSYNIKKDSSYDINLLNPSTGGYLDRLDMSWDKLAAIDFALIYLDPSGKEKMIRDVYDLNGSIFTSLGNTYTSQTSIHPFKFLSPSSNSVAFSVGNIVGLNSGTPKVLRITIRMKNADDSTNVSVLPTDFTRFPVQLREFTATSFDKTESKPAVAKVQTKIPLYPQLDNFFDYSLIGNNATNLPTPTTPSAPPTIP